MDNWTDPASMAALTADELSIAMEGLGINHHGCHIDGGDMFIVFQDIRDAETLVSLGVPAVHERGSLYDRASASCMTVGYLEDGNADPAAIDAAIEAGWTWTIHPYMVGRRMDWHASVSMSVADAADVAANLNAIRRVQS